MTSLDDAARSLTKALETLETRLEERLGELSERREGEHAVRRQARIARTHATAASDGLSSAVSDLKALLGGQGTH
jgi:prefoldin subunit 5